MDDDGGRRGGALLVGLPVTVAEHRGRDLMLRCWRDLDHDGLRLIQRMRTWEKVPDDGLKLF